MTAPPHTVRAEPDLMQAFLAFSTQVDECGLEKAAARTGQDPRLADHGCANCLNHIYDARQAARPSTPAILSRRCRCARYTDRERACPCVEPSTSR